MLVEMSLVDKKPIPNNWVESDQARLQICILQIIRERWSLLLSENATLCERENIIFSLQYNRTYVRYGLDVLARILSGKMLMLLQGQISGQNRAVLFPFPS